MSRVVGAAMVLIFGPRCEVLPAEWLHNPDNNLGHRYTPPSWLTALLGEDSP